MDQSKNTGSMDYAKLIAAFFVAAIHTSPLMSIGANADFLLTRILARMAVPFFFMVTGYFLLPQYLFEGSTDCRPFIRFIRKTLFLYGIAALMYLPTNFYAGHFSGITFWDAIRLLLFDGTFYHLWYLPATILGVFILITLRRLPIAVIATIIFILYGLGLSGDSYYGFLKHMPVLEGLYSKLFEITSYTRNGLFYAPAFLFMGAILHQKKRPESNKYFNSLGLFISTLCMIAEGFYLHWLDVQRHDSMYITLPICMYFLFRLVLLIRISPNKGLRIISTGIYLIHPMMIIVVRRFAKYTHTEALFIENSIIHYCTVCLLSFLFTWIYQKIRFSFSASDFPASRAWIEISRDALQHNVTVLQKQLPKDCILMPAVKANAYGHGATMIARELQLMGISAFCVATVTEGAELRRSGINGEILVLGYTHPQQFPLLKKYRLTQTVLDYGYGKELNRYGRKICVHVKIDTGMHRLGVRAEQIEDIRKIFMLQNLNITGTFTHLCAAETRTEPDYSYTLAQASAFRKVIGFLGSQGINCGKIHLLASYGLLNYPELGGNYARIGIALYGVLSTRPTPTDPTTLKPVLSLKVHISQIKELYAGESAGYGLRYVAKEHRRIAILPIGYADGIPRALSCCHGSVLINGKQAPIIGSICMDQMLIDITGISDVTTESIAVIIGRSGTLERTAYDLAEECKTITNEIVSRLGDRLTRIFT